MARVEIRIRLTYIGIGQLRAKWRSGMPRIARDLPGAQPVDSRGAGQGPPVTLPAGAEYIVTIRKLKRADDSFDELWCEIRIGDRLYRVPFRLL